MRAGWASTDTMQTYFGVTSVCGAGCGKSAFPQFNARGGPRDQDARRRFQYAHLPLQPALVRGGGHQRHPRLMGDAAESPISIADTNTTVTGMLGYRF